MTSLAQTGLPGARRARNYALASRLLTGLLIVLLFFLPVLYIIMVSLEQPAHFLSSPLTPSAHPAVANYSNVWNQGNLGAELVNTIIYSVAAAALTTVLSLLIAFPIARRLVAWPNGLYAFLVIGLFLPLSIIPLFIEAQKLGLFDNRAGYILLHVEPGLPLGVVLLTGFIAAVPRELDEAAWSDGCGYLRYLLRVIVPLTWSGLLITFLYSMLGVWNDIIGPVVFLVNPALFPISRGLFNFFGTNQSDWTLLAAGIVIASLPILALFIVTQRYFIRSAMGGAIKM
ncbi:MAG TPA: carbohydrate ABC transporter permease [Streptosporangiaceae bacterium]|nr:carbohydrate ABC transporter permease [Streptosporangiaceae bacterium]